MKKAVGLPDAYLLAPSPGPIEYCTQQSPDFDSAATTSFTNLVIAGHGTAKGFARFRDIFNLLESGTQRFARP